MVIYKIYRGQTQIHDNVYLNKTFIWLLSLLYW